MRLLTLNLFIGDQHNSKINVYDYDDNWLTFSYWRKNDRLYYDLALHLPKDSIAQKLLYNALIKVSGLNFYFEGCFIHNKKIYSFCNGVLVRSRIDQNNFDLKFDNKNTCMYLITISENNIRIDK